MKYAIQGNTFPVKDELKKLGAIWDASRKQWTVESVVVRDNAHKLTGFMQNDEEAKSLFYICAETDKSNAKFMVMAGMKANNTEAFCEAIEANGHDFFDWSARLLANQKLFIVETKTHFQEEKTIPNFKVVLASQLKISGLNSDPVQALKSLAQEYLEEWEKDFA